MYEYLPIKYRMLLDEKLKADKLEALMSSPLQKEPVINRINNVIEQLSPIITLTGVIFAVFHEIFGVYLTLITALFKALWDMAYLLFLDFDIESDNQDELLGKFEDIEAEYDIKYGQYVSGFVLRAQTASTYPSEEIVKKTISKDADILQIDIYHEHLDVTNSIKLNNTLTALEQQATAVAIVNQMSDYRRVEFDYRTDYTGDYVHIEFEKTAHNSQ